jgi:hypothetical protein
MQIRRLLLIVISLLVGAVTTWVIVYAYIPLGPVTIGFGTTFERFAWSNVVLLLISVAGIVGIWLDYFLDTKFLKS